MSLVTEEIKAKATEIYHGDEVCQVQFKRLLKEIGMPNGLLPLKDVVECGFVEESPKKGFVWMKQKKETKHKFEKIGRLVSYATEVTAYVEECKIKKLTGVKAKEILIWITINEISLANPTSDKIVFKTPTGMSRTFPTDAFVVEEINKVSDNDGKEKNREVDGGVNNGVVVGSVVKEV